MKKDFSLLATLLFWASARLFSQPFLCADPDFVNPNLACPAIYLPVCGCDGKTHGNGCEAVVFAGVTSFVPGECAANSGICDAPNAVAAQFIFDAELLAFDRQLLFFKDTTTVSIPDSLVQRALLAILSVWKSASLERDTVFDILKIHKHGSWWGNPREISVKMPASVAWGEQFQNGQIPTGDAAADAFLAAHGIVGEGISWSGVRFLFLKMPKSVNTIAFSTLAESELPGIENADPESFIGDGNRIEIDSWDWPMSIRFSHGWGDCPAGCIARRTWQFRIDEPCQAVFEKSWGSQITAASEPEPFKNLRFFADFDSKTLDLEADLGETEAFSIKIWDALGRLVFEKKGRSASVSEKIELPRATSGAYFLSLETARGRAARRFVF